MPHETILDWPRLPPSRVVLTPTKAPVSTEFVVLDPSRDQPTVRPTTPEGSDATTEPLSAGHIDVREQARPVSIGDAFRGEESGVRETGSSPKKGEEGVRRRRKPVSAEDEREAQEKLNEVLVLLREALKEDTELLRGLGDGAAVVDETIKKKMRVAMLQTRIQEDEMRLAALSRHDAQLTSAVAVWQDKCKHLRVLNALKVREVNWPHLPAMLRRRPGIVAGVYTALLVLAMWCAVLLFRIFQP